MNKQFNNSIRNGMLSISKKLNHVANKPHLPPVDSIGYDGDDHINIWERGSTDLGIALNHMADIPVTHSVYGKFRSIEGFWHYIRSVSHDDRTRMMAGYKAKKFGDNLEVQRVTNFKAIIMEANYMKIKQCAPLLEDVLNSTLPFDVYYLYNEEVRIRPAAAIWLIDGFEEIRSAIKEHREPNFVFLMDRKPNAEKDNAVEATRQERAKRKIGNISRFSIKKETAVKDKSLIAIDGVGANQDFKITKAENMPGNNAKQNAFNFPKVVAGFAEGISAEQATHEDNLLPDEVVFTGLKLIAEKSGYKESSLAEYGGVIYTKFPEGEVLTAVAGDVVVTEGVLNLPVHFSLSDYNSETGVLSPATEEAKPLDETPVQI